METRLRVVFFVSLPEVLWLAVACAPPAGPPSSAGAPADTSVEETGDTGHTGDSGVVGPSTTTGDSHTGELVGTPNDRDGDGFLTDDDCDDFDPSAYPGGPDQFGDGVDGNCDGSDGVALLFAEGWWLKAQLGYSLAVADIDGDGRDEVAAGMPAVYFATYDPVIEAGAITLFDDDLTRLATIHGDAGDHALGTSMAFIDVDGAPILATHSGLLGMPLGENYLLDPLQPGLDGQYVSDVTLQLLEGHENRVMGMMEVHGELWAGVAEWDEDNTWRVVRMGVPFADDALSDPDVIITSSSTEGVGYRVEASASGGIVLSGGGLEGAMHWFESVPTDAGIEGADRSWYGPHARSGFGLRVEVLEEPAGPLAVAGAHSDETDYPNAGRVYVFDPRAQAGTPPLATIVADAPHRYLGGVLLAGDFDGDGIEDLVVGAPGDPHRYGTRGAAYLFRGPVRGELTLDAAAWSFIDPHAVVFSGLTFEAGDFDGDDRLDLVIARHFYSTAEHEHTGRIDVVLNHQLGL